MHRTAWSDPKAMLHVAVSSQDFPYFLLSLLGKFQKERQKPDLSGPGMLLRSREMRCWGATGEGGNGEEPSSCRWVLSPLFQQVGACLVLLSEAGMKERGGQTGSEGSIH